MHDYLLRLLKFNIYKKRGTKIKSINPLRRFQKSSILIHILHHASIEPFYGSWLKNKLTENNYNISDGTLYPWLSRLTFSGFLSMKKKIVKGKIRKYYSITDNGKIHLEKIKEYLTQLFNEIIK